MKKLFLLLMALFTLAQVKAQEKSVIQISTDNTDLILQVAPNGRLYQAYLGDKLLNEQDIKHFSPYVKGGSDGSVSTRGWEVYPGSGAEDYFEPAVAITHSDGNPSTILRYVSSEQKAVTGGTETIINLKDDQYPVEVTLHYIAYPKENVIKTWSEIKHNEKKPVTLWRYASTMLYFSDSKYFLTEFSSDWAKEAQMSSQQLQFGKKVIDTKLGSRAAMHTHPFFELGFGQSAQETQGRVMLGTIGWTGNFQFTFEVDNVGNLRVIPAINSYASDYELKANEVFTTPEFMFTFSNNGTGEASRNLHAWARNYQLKDGQGDRLSLLNNWENTYFKFDEQLLSELMKEAKHLGVDMFLLDDGWFGNKHPRNSDNAGLGDWEAMKSKLPGGIPALVKSAKEAGVKFGIWIEPEMVNPKSELFEKHPDWAITLPNRKTYYYRNQLVLDLSNPKVQDFVFGVVDNILTENPEVAYFKWDCNSPITNVYSPYLKNKQGQLYIDHVRGIYNVLKRVKEKYPNTPMMLCSGGGARCDYEALKYFTEFWCSDNTDAINRTRIQYGTSFFYPISAMGAHVSAVPNHQTGRVTSFHTRGVTAMAGTFGYELNPTLLSDEEKQQIREQIKTYKKYETLINEGTYWRLSDPFTDEIAAWMSVSEEQDHALVSVVRLMAEANQATVYVRLRGLKPDAVYLEEQSGRQYSGAALMHAGIPLPPFTGEYEAYQFAFTELKEAGRLYEKVQKWCDGNAENRVVISIYGGSGSGKTTLATALQQYFLNDGTGCYLLSGDDYPHRIPKRNDEERMRVYKEAGEDGLRGYLGTKKEIDFDRINEVLAAFHEGKDSITLRHMGREDGEISSEETDFFGISVLLLEWTHGGSDDLHGVDLPVFLESSPEETKERRIRRNRDENAASPFICRVVELEQEKLEVQRKNAGLIVGKDGSVYEQ